MKKIIKTIICIVICIGFVLIFITQVFPYIFLNNMEYQSILKETKSSDSSYLLTEYWNSKAVDGYSYSIMKKKMISKFYWIIDVYKVLNDGNETLIDDTGGIVNRNDYKKISTLTMIKYYFTSIYYRILNIPFEY